MNYQICTNCVLDTNDLRIHFDKNGKCDQCNDFKTNIEPSLDWEKKKVEFDRIVNKIKKDGKIPVIINESDPIGSYPLTLLP